MWKVFHWSFPQVTIHNVKTNIADDKHVLSHPKQSTSARFAMMTVRLDDQPCLWWVHTHTPRSSVSIYDYDNNVRKLKETWFLSVNVILTKLIWIINILIKDAVKKMMEFLC